MNILVWLPIIIVLIALNFFKLNRLAWVAALWIATYLLLNYGIDPPLPSSIILMFMAIVTLALLVYLSSDSHGLEDVRNTLVRFIVDRKYSMPLIFVMALIPILAALKAYSDASKLPKPPLTGRTIHPPPPSEIQFKGKTFDIAGGENPYRELKNSNPSDFQNHVENGRTIYYENCVFCHGDNMEGDGIFTEGYDPIPANFRDGATIAILRESYLFWRIAKGAHGLPDESSPWSSAMPAWEDFLSEEEIWDVILFLYEFTDQKPRAKEAVE